LGFIFLSRALERLYMHNEGASKFHAVTVKLFWRRVRHMEAARDACDLRVPPGVHYERLDRDSRNLEALRRLR
jgi:plasmid maintenance system killer protein